MNDVDLIITNGRVYTVDANQPWAEALACRDGRLLALGSNADIQSLAGPETKKQDAGGRLILPGLIDAHVHFLQYAIRRQQVPLFGIADFREVQEKVAAACYQAQPGEWIIGWGWDENLWDVQPHARYLDAVAPDNPVVLARMDMHTWWVNSRAMQQAHLSRETVDPPDCVVERDQEGRPTGLLREWNAIDLVEPYLPQPDDETLLSWLRAALAEAHQLGLTGFHDQRVEKEGKQSLSLFQRLRQTGLLQHRVHANIAADYIGEAATLGLRSGFGGDLLWLGHMKAFADGSMGSQTALLLQPYTNEPDNRGVCVTGKDELWEIARSSAEAGFSVSVHAIGDKAVRDMLDVLSELESVKVGADLALPQRIEHVQLIHPDDLARLAQLHVVASMQPVHLQTDWDVADRVWGERARYTYAFRSLLEHGTRIAFGSDAPVAPLNPMLGIHAAVNRKDRAGKPDTAWHPAERLTVSEAVHGYTVEPAYLSGRLARFGSLTPGKWADFIVLSQDIFAEPVETLAETQVEHTFFAGELVYSR